ncbi:MAG: DUF4097 family beta strand repeat protein [Sedimentisphaerales bacterium]|nr:DUF4097 family beta strand repeat protein [Sedimentisphaerales bacterium]
MNRCSVAAAMHAVLMTALTALLSGCAVGSVSARLKTPQAGYFPYMGVAYDLEHVYSSTGTLLVLDIPFSAVVDTALAPFDLLRVLAYEEWGTYERVKQVSFPMAGIDNLVIESPAHFNVKLKGADVNESSIEAKIQATGTPKRFQRLVDKLRIDAIPHGGTLHVRLHRPEWDHQTNPSVWLSIMVPRRTSVSCTASGYVSATGVHGNMELHTGVPYHNIRVQDTRGSLRLTTDFGGDIECADVASGQVAAKSERGHIHIGLSPSAPSDARVLVQTTEGEIRLWMPNNFAGGVAFETRVGSVHTTLPVVGQVSNNRVRGDVGNGHGEVHLQSEDGRITVKTSNASLRDVFGAMTEGELKTGTPDH